MGVNFCLESLDDEKLSIELINVGLTKNWRECGGIGCYSLLGLLIGYTPTLSYDLVIDLETMKEMYDCVNYFIANSVVCNEVDYPNWCKQSVEYQDNINIEMEINENMLDQSKLLAKWLKIGIDNDCIIEIY